MDASELLRKACQGDTGARGELIRATYDELRALAAQRMREERPDHTLTATALVHEVSLQLLERDQITIESHRQFLALAAKAMRNLLVDHARSRGRQKRGGGQKKLPLDEALLPGGEDNQQLIDLHEALERLNEIDERKSKVVELRYFGGMSVKDTAASLEVSEATVKRDWEVAKAWLLSDLKRGDSRVE